MEKEEMMDFLKKHAKDVKLINHEHGFSRTISFKVANVVYIIVWYVNVSTLFLGESEHAPFIPFRYIYKDTTYPTRWNNLGFSYVKLKKESFLDRDYPYEVLRIPLPN